MKTKLLFTDPHIESNSLEELEKIFKEILSYEAKELIMLGDFYDKNHPSPEELLFGSSWVKKFVKKYKKVIFLKGTGAHDRYKGYNTVDYLLTLGVRVVEEYIDENNNYYGHCFTDMSNFEYGTHKYLLKDLKKKYNYIFLGHLHNFQQLSNKAWHISSCRWKNWGEVTDKNKYIVLLDEKPKFISIKSATPMLDIYSVKDLKKKGYKLRLVYKDYEKYKNEINCLSNDVKIKCDFTKENKIIESIDKKDILLKGIEQIEDKDVKGLISNTMDEILK